MPVASAMKIFWKKYLSYTSFKHKIELGKIPVNCQFLEPKRKNDEIWSVILPSSCSRDKGIQDIQTITAASASLIIQVSTDMSQYLAVASKKSGGKIDNHASSNRNQRLPFPCRKNKSKIKPV